MNSSMNQISRAQTSTSPTARGFQRNPEHSASNQYSDVTPLQSHIGASTQHSNQPSSLQRPQSFASSIHSSDMAPLQPPGTMLPGTPLSLNGHSIIIEKFLAEGFFTILRKTSYFFTFSRWICACISGQWRKWCQDGAQEDILSRPIFT
jgi:hypothetical protein